MNVARDAGGPAPARRPARAAPWLAMLALALAALSRGIAEIPLIDPDEGRNAEVAREMAARGDFVVPHLNGLPYLDKPVFFFAAAALSIEALGATELAVRLPALLAVCATVPILIAFGARRFDRETAWLAGVALASSPLALAFARIVIFDSSLMLWVTASCVAFLRARESGRAAWWIAAWGATGAASLTKGPVGLVLPLLLNLAHARICGERVGRLFHPIGLLAFLVVVGPWFGAVAVRHPEFPHYAFVRETLERVATDRMNRTGPLYYFLPLLIGGALPWVLVPLAGARELYHSMRGRSGDPRTRALAYLLLWIGLPLLLFSLSQSKRPGYLLPVLPAVALLSAHAFFALPAARRRAGILHCVLAAAAAAVAVLAMPRIAMHLHPPELAQAVKDAASGVAVALLCSSLATGAALHRRAPLALAAAMLLAPTLVTLASHGVFKALGAGRSAKALAASIRAAAPPEVRVVAIDTYPASLSFYLEREIPVSSPRGSELRSNYIAEYATSLRALPGTTLLPADAWRIELRDCPTPTVFVIRTHHTPIRAELEAELPLLAAESGYSAFGPCRPRAR